MATITFPAVRMPSEFSMDLLVSQYASGSGETLSGQIVETLGAPWVFRFVWQQFDPEDTDLMRAFLDSMDGIANVTRLWNILRPTPKGTITGAPLVDGAGQTGTTLNLKGMTAGRTFALGDMIGRANRVHRVVAPATVDGAGKCALSIRPAILVGTSNEEVVTLDKPKAYARLRQNFNSFGSAAPLRKGWGSGLALEFIEVLP